jgi:hypothetical protein
MAGNTCSANRPYLPLTSGKAKYVFDVGVTLDQELSDPDQTELQNLLLLERASPFGGELRE